MAGIRIRQAEIADVEAVRAVVGEVAREGVHLAFTEPFSLAETALYLARMIEAGHPYLVAVDGARIVGFGDVSTKAGAVYRHVGILGLGVAASHRRQGIGARLLARLLDASRGRWEQVELAVYATNVPAQSLYRKFGFVERGRLPKGRKADGRYDDVILMSLFLDG
jgi:putative acetyltransferase